MIVNHSGEDLGVVNNLFRDQWCACLVVVMWHWHLNNKKRCLAVQPSLKPENVIMLQHHTGVASDFQTPLRT